jgi:hypothetical protein
MMIPPPYRPAASARKGSGSYVVDSEGAPAAAFGAAIFEQGDLRLSSGDTLKKMEFCMRYVEFLAGPRFPFCSRRPRPASP